MIFRVVRIARRWVQTLLPLVFLGLLAQIAYGEGLSVSPSFGAGVGYGAGYGIPVGFKSFGGIRLGQAQFLTAHISLGGDVKTWISEAGLGLDSVTVFKPGWLVSFSYDAEMLSSTAAQTPTNPNAQHSWKSLQTLVPGLGFDLSPTLTGVPCDIQIILNAPIVLAADSDIDLVNGWTVGDDLRTVFPYSIQPFLVGIEVRLLSTGGGWMGSSNNTAANHLCSVPLIRSHRRFSLARIESAVAAPPRGKQWSSSPRNPSCVQG